MTVQELIDELNKVENKSIPVSIAFDSGHFFYYDMYSDKFFIEVDEREVTLVDR